MSKLKNHKVGVLSFNMKRRLNVALCCLGDFSVLVLDEPTYNLSEEDKVIVWKYIEAIKSQSKVFFITTTIQREVEILSNRIGIISKRGELLKSGNTKEVFDNLRKKYGYKLYLRMRYNFREEIDYEYIIEKVDYYLVNAILFEKTTNHLIYILHEDTKNKIQIF